MTAFGFPSAGTTHACARPLPNGPSTAGASPLPPPHPAARTATTRALVVQLDQHRAARDTVSFLHVDGAHGRVVRRGERRLHLHRLEHDERLARGDGRTFV